MEINRADVLASLTKAFYDYEESLVNNNIERLNNLFFSHERTIRYGTNATEHLLGHEAIAAFRRSRPPGPSQRSERECWR
ncbi:MAG: AtzH-like domain-containing protein [Betaproteobacteria bacterium]